MVYVSSVDHGRVVNHLYALEEGSGERKWKMELNSAWISPMVLTRDSLYVLRTVKPAKGTRGLYPLYEKHVQAINRNTGEISWDLEGENMTLLRVSSLGVYIADNGTLRVLCKDTGVERWSVNVRSEIEQNKKEGEDGLLRLFMFPDEDVLVGYDSGEQHGLLWNQVP